METLNDEIARLDMAARAKGGEVFFSRGRWSLLFLSLILAALAIESTASFYETLSIRVAAFFAVLTTVILWSNWRYKFYLPALFFLSIGIGALFLVAVPGIGRSLQTTLNRVFWVCRGGVLGIPSYYLWRQARLFSAVNAPGWEKEQYQVDHWLDVLTTPGRTQEIIEFSTGSFWTRYYTYRLMRPGPYWVIAKFNRGNTRRPFEYRVRELRAVTFMMLPVGETMVTIGKRRMRAVNVSPPM
jgi:hypothetical protein